MVTDGEDSRLNDMGEGIVLRYDEAHRQDPLNVPKQPLVLYTDRDCCGANCILKLFPGNLLCKQISSVHFSLSICRFYAQFLFWIYSVPRIIRHDKGPRKNVG